MWQVIKMSNVQNREFKSYRTLQAMVKSLSLVSVTNNKMHQRI